MTIHAIERIGERFRMNPEACMAEIRASIARGANAVCREVAGNDVIEVALSNGETAFPVVTRDGSIKTVLVEGMAVTTATGTHELRRTPLATGVYEIPGDRYHADPCSQPSLSSTLAKTLLAKSPLHAWTDSPRLNPDWEPTEKKSFDIGRAAHRAVLGKGGDYVAIPDELLSSNGAASTKAAKEFIEEARADGLVPLKSDEVEAIHAMRDVAQLRLAHNQIEFDPARSELTAIASIEGVDCRAMLDNVPLAANLPIYDFKTCESAAVEACERSILNYGYDVQAEHYRQVWKAATGEDRVFRFVFQEKTAPFEVSVVEVGPDTLALARKKIARAREIWRLCLRENSWPGYPSGVHRVELPEWHHARWLERESVESDYRRRTGQDIIEFAMRIQSPHAHEGVTN